MNAPAKNLSEKTDLTALGLEGTLNTQNPRI